MSSTNRGSKRVEQDAYQTPKWCVEAIMKEIEWSRVQTFLEPCAGDGNILRPISEKVKLCWSAEIKEGRDYLKMTSFPRVDLIITNPPFSKAIKFLKISLRGANTVVYLLRLNFLGSQTRKAFWGQNQPTHLFVLSKRPMYVDVCKTITYQDAARIEQKEKGCGAVFPPGEVKQCPYCEHPVGPGSDSTEYAWFIWDRGGIIKREPGIYVL